MAEDTCPVFRPSEEEFSNFRTYMESIHSAHPHIGICKIIPPRSWKGPEVDVQKLNIKVAAPVKQHVSGKHGVCQVELLEQRSIPLNAFYHAAVRSEYFNPDYAERERRFWKYILGNSGFGVPMYGADVPGTLFDGTESHPSWNLNHLDNMLQELPMILPGVNTTMLYIGSWRAMFAFHVEDMDLYSINYLHFGAPKSWYGISPTYRRRFEQMAEKFYPTEFSQCHQFLRHKTKIFSPQRLQEERIPFDTALQHPGEFMITFPGSYHAGFNHGFNIAEAINFALSHWLEVGRQAYSCVCMRDAVSLDVNLLETIHIQEIVRCLKQQQTIPTWALRVLPLPKVPTQRASHVADEDAYFLTEPESSPTMKEEEEEEDARVGVIETEEKVGLESLNGRLRCVCHYEVQYCSVTDLAESPSAPGFSFTSSSSATFPSHKEEMRHVDHERGDSTTRDYFFETMATESASMAEKTSPTSSFSADDGTASSSLIHPISTHGSPYFFELPINASREYDLHLLTIPQCHVCHDITVQRRLHRGRSPLSKQSASLLAPTSHGSSSGMGTRQGKRKRDHTLAPDDDAVDSPKIKQSVSFDEKTTPSHTDPGTSSETALPDTPTTTSASSLVRHPPSSSGTEGPPASSSPSIATELFPFDAHSNPDGHVLPAVPIDTIDLVDDDASAPAPVPKSDAIALKRTIASSVSAVASTPTSSTAVHTSSAPAATEPMPASSDARPSRRRRPLMVMPARIIHAIPSTLPPPNDD
eukprot:gene14105-10078_t